jgi:hypothetical protein
LKTFSVSEVIINIVFNLSSLSISLFIFVPICICMYIVTEKGNLYGECADIDTDRMSAGNDAWFMMTMMRKIDGDEMKMVK